ncbi:hypothetical protein R1flu_002508 [Riccia fluitans]|uniref:NB-ARC domain-containing protein n=1 Tax=Riccia fluitans TaxID=41844 RepID=A0ABD1Y6B2_9MARC
MFRGRSIFVPSGIWHITWLPKCFPQVRILCTSYDSSVEKSSTRGRMDLHLLGENLIYSLIKVAQVGQRCPVVLVGHCVGGLVLKQVCIQADLMGARFDGPGFNPYKTFLSYMRGVFFYATPHLGSQLRIGKEPNHRGPLLKYFKIYCKQSARINENFSKLRHLLGWMAVGVSEGSETEYGNAILSLNISSRKRSHSTLIVDEGTSRCDLDEFSVLSGEDHFSISRPKTEQSNSYLRLVTFVVDVLRKEERRKFIFYSKLHCPHKQFVDEHGRVEEVIQKLQLSDEIESSRLALVGMSGVGKTTLAKQVLVSVMKLFDYVCFIEDMSEELKFKEFSALVEQNLFHGNGAEVCVQRGFKHSVWNVLQERRVLMVIDGVERIEHANLFLRENWCAKGSRLVITSCIHNEELRSHFHIHEVPFLSAGEAKRLFTSHLTHDVKKVIPEDLIDAVTGKCDGLPLTLVVLGRYLRRSKDVVE